MLETPEEMPHLQALLDASMAAAGPHLRGIITDERRLERRGADGAPAGHAAAGAGHGDRRRAAAGRAGRRLLPPRHLLVQLGRDSVRMRHLAARPACSATHLPGRSSPSPCTGGPSASPSMTRLAELRQAMLDEYLPKQGPAFEEWLTARTPSGRASCRRRCSPSTWRAIGGAGERAGQSATRRRPRWRRRAAPAATCGSPPCSCG